MKFEHDVWCHVVTLFRVTMGAPNDNDVGIESNMSGLRVGYYKNRQKSLEPVKGNIPLKYFSNFPDTH